ncbi:hypothetical protein [Xanthomonas citri]|uniref:ApeA N-terminal domain 1-containing protein n=1 Tax=Xanthomonas citri TaxID=346 RepID=UPI00124A4055|nr:hypothetical protein [Xanthomonas citri]QTJ31197.1 hypothetical protein XcfCFBP6975P_24105 [Xanthomonas citri pv. phaseoli var. fuscans]
MVKPEANLLEEVEWAVTLYPHDRPEAAFGAQLKYSPTTGLKLRYAIEMDKCIEDTIDFLYGHTNLGEPLTLVGKFEPNRAGFKMKHGYNFRVGETGFQYAIFGLHCSSDTTFEKFHFDISGAEDFFGNANFRRHSNLSEKPFYSSTLDLGTIEVNWRSQFELSGNIVTALYDKNSEAMKRLQDALDEIKKEHPGFRPLYKKNVDYTFTLIPKEELKILDAYRACNIIADLFAIISFSPTRILRMLAIARDESNYQYEMTIFPSQITHHDTLSRIKKLQGKPPFTINIEDIDLARTFDAWTRERANFSTTLSRIQSQGFVIASHDVLAGIVLSATQLESIGHQEGHKTSKYQHPIENYACSSLKAALAAQLKCTESTIGQKISDLRNEIAHVGRPKILLQQFNIREQHVISMMLDLVVLGYLMMKIEVSRVAMEKYQKSLLTKLII